MKNTFLALLVCCLYACDYSTSSNGNIDAAYSRENPATEAHDEHHNTEEHGTVQEEGQGIQNPEQQHEPANTASADGEKAPDLDHNEEAHEPASQATVPADSASSISNEMQHHE